MSEGFSKVRIGFLRLRRFVWWTLAAVIQADYLHPGGFFSGVLEQSAEKLPEHHRRTVVTEGARYHSVNEYPNVRLLSASRRGRLVHRDAGGLFPKVGHDMLRE